MNNSLIYKESSFSWFLYGFLILTTVYLGCEIVRKYDNNDFYINFMLKWKHVMLDYQYSGIPLPELDRQAPLSYMQELSNIIANRDLLGSRPDFIYEIKSANGKINKAIIVAQADILHVYGIDAGMANNLDRMIDGDNNLAAGNWLAFKAENKDTYHALWLYKKS